jgi:hypothetical protein
MLLSLLYFALRFLLQALAPSGRSDFEREVEVLVLTHQLKVLSRGGRRLPFRRRDRMLLAAASRILRRERWEGVHRDPSNPAPVAAGAGAPHVDVSPSRAGGAVARSGDGRAHRSNGEREPQVGLPEDPR